MTEGAKLSALEEALGHRFARLDLLVDALTHRSFANEKREIAPRDNERLEFLGDAVLALSIANLLAARFPDAPEGELTRRRADLVCEASLASIAEDVDLGTAIRLGRGEERSGGRSKPRLLASALEACLGAILIDAGIAVACEVAQHLFETRIEAVAPGRNDHKSRVQEVIQARRGATPRYVVLSSSGPDHDRRFEVALEVEGDRLGVGAGRSKGEAEQAAALAALHALDERAERPA